MGNGRSRFPATARGEFLVKTAWDGEPAGSVPTGDSNEWTEYEAEVAIPDGVSALYLEYRGKGAASLRSFRLER